MRKQFQSVTQMGVSMKEAMATLTDEIEDAADVLDQDVLIECQSLIEQTKEVGDSPQYSYSM
jgi:hypothetical protein